MNYSDTFGLTETQTIGKDALRDWPFRVFKMSTGCSVLLDVHSEISLAWVSMIYILSSSFYSVLTALEFKLSSPCSQILTIQLSFSLFIIHLS